MRRVSATRPERDSVIRIAYFGLPLGACLLERHGLSPALAVLSPTDAPGRRRLKRALGPAVLDARDASDPAELERAVAGRFSREPPDLLVSWYWTRRLPPRFLEIPRLGALGVHPSLLPRHRGPNPFFAAIDAGDAVSGVTVHRLTAGYDEGDIVATEAVPVGDRNSWQLARALDRPSLRALLTVVGAVARGEPLEGRPQDAAVATWAPEPAGDLLGVTFSWPTNRVLRRIRALSPVPGVPLEICGASFFLTGARPALLFPASLLPGEAAATGDGIVIRTGDGAILCLSAQVVEDEGEDEGGRDDARLLDARQLAAFVGITPVEGARSVANEAAGVAGG